MFLPSIIFISFLAVAINATLHEKTSQPSSSLNNGSPKFEKGNWDPMLLEVYNNGKEKQRESAKGKEPSSMDPFLMEVASNEAELERRKSTAESSKSVGERGNLERQNNDVEERIEEHHHHEEDDGDAASRGNSKNSQNFDEIGTPTGNMPMEMETEEQNGGGNGSGETEIINFSDHDDASGSMGSSRQTELIDEPMEEERESSETDAETPVAAPIILLNENNPNESQQQQQDEEATSKQHSGRYNLRGKKRKNIHPDIYDYSTGNIKLERNGKNGKKGNEENGNQNKKKGNGNGGRGRGRPRKNTESAPNGGTQMIGFGDGIGGGEGTSAGAIAHGEVAPPAVLIKKRHYIAAKKTPINYYENGQNRDDSPDEESARTKMRPINVLTHHPDFAAPKEMVPNSEGHNNGRSLAAVHQNQAIAEGNHQPGIKANYARKSAINYPVPGLPTHRMARGNRRRGKPKRRGRPPAATSNDHREGGGGGGGKIRPVLPVGSGNMEVLGNDAEAIGHAAMNGQVPNGDVLVGKGTTSFIASDGPSKVIKDVLADINMEAEKENTAEENEKSRHQPKEDDLMKTTHQADDEIHSSGTRRNKMPSAAASDAAAVGEESTKCAHCGEYSLYCRLFCGLS